MDKLEISNYYNTISRSYNELYGEEQVQKYKATLDKDVVRRSNVILDLGMGMGNLVRYLDETSKRHIYFIGIDISIQLVRMAPQSTTNIYTDYLICDAEDPPIRLDKVDIVTSYTVAHHFNNPFKVIEECLMNGVEVVIFTFLGFELEELAKNIRPVIENLPSNNKYDIGIDYYRKREIILVLKRR